MNIPNAGYHTPASRVHTSVHCISCMTWMLFYFNGAKSDRVYV